MSSSGKKKGRSRRIAGSVLALCGTFGLIVKGASDIWSAGQIAHWVASAVGTLSSSLAWQLSIALAVLGFALIFVSSRAASALTKSIGSDGVQRMRHAGVLALIAAFVLGFVGSRHATTKRVMIAKGPTPTPETAPPLLPGTSSPRPAETRPKQHDKPASNHAHAEGPSQGRVEDVSYTPDQSSLAATTASCSSCKPGSTVPSGTEASYYEPAPREEESGATETDESGTESAGSTTIYEDTSSAASTSSESAESSASASSSVSVTGGNGSESIVDSSQSASSSSESSSSSSSSVNMSETTETSVSES